MWTASPDEYVSGQIIQVIYFLIALLSRSCRGLGGPVGPLVWGLWSHTVRPQVGVFQNDTMNLFGGRA